MLFERLFFMVAFLLLVHNVGHLIVFDEKRLFINLAVVREQFLILFLLVYFIHKMPETVYRRTVSRWLMFFLFVFALGGIANKRVND